MVSSDFDLLSVFEFILWRIRCKLYLVSVLYDRIFHQNIKKLKKEQEELPHSCSSSKIPVFIIEYNVKKRRIEYIKFKRETNSAECKFIFSPPSLFSLFQFIFRTDLDIFHVASSQFQMRKTKKKRLVDEEKTQFKTRLFLLFFTPIRRLFIIANLVLLTLLYLLFSIHFYFIFVFFLRFFFSFFKIDVFFRKNRKQFGIHLSLSPKIALFHAPLVIESECVILFYFGNRVFCSALLFLGWIFERYKKIGSIPV